MQNPKFSVLSNHVQEVIDLIARKDNQEANNKLSVASELLDELLDFLDEDEDLIQIIHYQVLLNQLHQKINSLN
jgi:hypothetical protein